MRRAGAAVMVAVLVAGSAAMPQTGAPTLPQLSQGVPQLPFVTLDDARLFADSAWGKALLQRLQADQTALATENREIEARLADKERALTARRAALAPAEFRTEADAFNAEVESYRAAQKAKEQAVYQRHDAARLRFRDVANQVLAQLMAERGALAIIAEEAIVLGFREIDITTDAVARMDALVGDGARLPDPDGPAAPETEPVKP
jgi:Skp family chaperone for outer membrane proteins